MVPGDKYDDFETTRELTLNMIARVEQIHLKKMEPHEPGSEEHDLPEWEQPESEWNELEPTPKSRIDLHPKAPEPAPAAKFLPRRADLLELYLSALAESCQPGKSVILLSRYHRPISIVRQILLGFCNLTEQSIYSGEISKEYFPMMTRIAKQLAESRLNLPDFEIKDLWALVPLLDRLAADECETSIFFTAPEVANSPALVDQCRYLAKQTDLPVYLFSSSQNPDPF